MTRSITESKNAPRWLAWFEALASAPSSRSGERGQHDQQQPGPESAHPDGDRRRDPQEQAQERQVVRAQARCGEDRHRAA